MKYVASIFSSINFLIYCSVGEKFKKVGKKHSMRIFKKRDKGKRLLTYDVSADMGWGSIKFWHLTMVVV